MTTTKDGVRPERAIRRFAVFAEYTRQERLEQGDAEDEAKGYGIWLAKVVSSRRFGSKGDTKDRHCGGQPAKPRAKFRSVGGELQTDDVFDHDIVERKGVGFYRDVFAPAIAEARSGDKSYEDIRDTIRKEWKPPKSRS